MNLPEQPVKPAESLVQPLCRGLFADIRSMCWAVDPEAARLRAAHLNAVMRLTAPTMAANLGCAALVTWVFRDRLGVGLLAWLLGMVALCALPLWAGSRPGARNRERASPRVLRRAALHSALLAAAWGGLAVVSFPLASHSQRMVVATLVTGMIGAGSFVLSPLPLASLAYVLVFSVASLWALWSTGDADLMGVAVLLCFYSPMVALGSLAAWRKATALIRAQTQSARQERLLALVLHDFEQQAGEALWEIGPDGRLRHHSPRLADLMSLPVEADQPFTLLQWVERRSPVGAERLREAFNQGRSFRDLQLPWDQGGTEKALAISGKRLTDESGRTLGWRGVLADVSEKVRSERLLRQLAHTDSLTGLANRFVLRDRLAQALARGGQVGLLSIDLDHFKSINDSHGHSAGDELLAGVAQRLQACVRAGDLVARLGGDEFAVLMQDLPSSALALRMAERVVSSLADPMDVMSRRLRAGASVGLAVGAGAAASVDELLVQADLALYEAKGSGRGRCVLYTPELGDSSRRRLSIEEGLRSALKRGELALHWQAQVDLASWRISGAEALMRWTHPELGVVNPGEFIEVAEQCGLIDDLGRWALFTACDWAASHFGTLTISVNVSPIQLRDEGFVEQVRQALLRSGLHPGRLELEITESVFIGDAELALRKLHALRALGVKVALDDFGTGYSSLSYLRRFPFDTLKIDRAFVREVLQQGDARAIVEMMANLARTLGMRTVCEGVETDIQLQAVRDAGCDQVQGYLISRPCPADDLLRLWAAWQAPAAMPAQGV
ncbi:putative bifunctional diguanylate cyclase/phosphodiesterase [Ideonella sp.]|uniref:putative bifunctional diguanylate cyclase/phosphodiesterase n=1 Tax=Ideonella sp. TaxID=1929293 RepID=UPI003BB65548